MQECGLGKKDTKSEGFHGGAAAVESFKHPARCLFKTLKQSFSSDKNARRYSMSNSGFFNWNIIFKRITNSPG